MVEYKREGKESSEKKEWLCRSQGQEMPQVPQKKNDLFFHIDEKNLWDRFIFIFRIMRLSEAWTERKTFRVSIPIPPISEKNPRPRESL